MKRLRTICTVACLVLAMGGLAHAASIDTVTLTPNPAARGTRTTLTVTTTDDIDYVEYSLNEGATWTQLGALGGPFTCNIVYYHTGIHEVFVRGIINEELVAEESILLVVYDPDAGFVTGAGWIDSPEGAYTPDGVPTLLTGRAHFAFVSKYTKGATTPTGHTGFVFKAGDFNFHSSSYDWLLVKQGGTNAQFKGEGTINGEGDYKFMLWAHDDKDYDPDAFRIKIWTENGEGEEDVVYDNGFENSGYENGQPISSGNIIIHSDKDVCPLCGGNPCVPPCPNAT